MVYYLSRNWTDLTEIVYQPLKCNLIPEAFIFQLCLCIYKAQWVIWKIRYHFVSVQSKFFQWSILKQYSTITSSVCNWEKIVLNTKHLLTNVTSVMFSFCKNSFLNKNTRFSPDHSGSDGRLHWLCVHAPAHNGYITLFWSGPMTSSPILIGLPEKQSALELFTTMWLCLRLLQTRTRVYVEGDQFWGVW